MSSPPAPIDEAVLETFAERARSHSLVATVEPVDTGGTISMVRLRLDRDRYPDQIRDARVELQWYTNGDYNIHYIETHRSDEVWQCRWDRHPNPHTNRIHFHPPPEAESSDAMSDHPSDRHPAVIFTRTLANIRQRIEALWEDVPES